MRLTKNVIDHIVDKLVEPAIQKKIELGAEIEGIVKKTMLKKLPVRVIKLWESQSKFLRYESSVRVHYRGSYNWVHLKEALPAESYVINIEDADDSQRLLDIDSEKKKLTAKIEATRSSLTTTLKALSTYEKVREEFPEAAAYLPDENGVEDVPAINIEDIRLNLKTLI